MSRGYITRRLKPKRYAKYGLLPFAKYGLFPLSRDYLEVSAAVMRNGYVYLFMTGAVIIYRFDMITASVTKEIYKPTDRYYNSKGIDISHWLIQNMETTKNGLNE